MYLYIYRSVDLFVSLSIFLPTYLPTYPPIHPLIYYKELAYVVKLVKQF